MSAVDTRGVLSLEDRNRTRLLTLERPKSKNAFSDDLYDAVRDALDDAAADPGIACAVVTGAGDAFSAGQDLAEMALPPRHADGLPHGFVPFMEALVTFPKPLIAAVNGVAVGIGVTMLLHCDIVLAGRDRARFRAPFVSLGITAEAGSTFTMPALIGWQETARLLYTSAWVDAAEAVRIGLALRAVPDADLLAEARALAGEIAAMPIASLVETKRVLAGARLDAIRAAMARENAANMRLGGGPANREAIAAFREKRKPDFTNLPGA